jgi:acyl-CoA dehydrogenase
VSAASEPGVDLFLEPRHESLAARVGDFVRDRLAPARIDDEAPGAALRLLNLLAQEGILDHVVPAPYGGAADPLDLRSICVVREALASASGLADALFIMQGLGSHPLLLGGAEALKAEFLPGLRTGEQAAAIAITEPDAGSDLGAVATTARRDGDDYVLDGHKHFISNAGFATFYSLLARTGSPSEGRHALTFFLVEDDRAGLSTSPQRLISPHPVGEVRLQGCRVPASHRLGEEGSGFDLALKTLNFFRASVGAAAVGFAARALGESLSHAAARRQFGQAIAEFQGVQFYLADMATQIDAARLLVQQAAAAQDRGEGRPELASMAKLFATEAAGRVADLAVQIHGGAGLVAGSPVERIYREVRSLRIYEGTSEIQRNVISRELLRR